MKNKALSISVLAILLILTAFSLTACKKESKMAAGTYEAGAKGYSDKKDIRLSLTVDESGAIYDINILDHGETEDIGTRALDKLIKEAKEKNSAELDTISGATRTCEGFRDALKLAMKEAEEAAKNKINEKSEDKAASE